MPSLFSNSPGQYFESNCNRSNWQTQDDDEETLFLERPTQKVLTWDSLDLSWTLGPNSPFWALTLHPGHDLKSNAGFGSDINASQYEEVEAALDVKSGQLIQDASSGHTNVDFVAPAQSMMRLFRAVSNTTLPLNIYIHKVGGCLIITENQDTRQFDTSPSSMSFNTFIKHSYVPRTSSVNRFNQMGMWRVCGENIVTGSDLVCVKLENNPNIALYLEDLSSQRVALADCFLECVMAGVPEFVISSHHNGIIQSNRIYKTKDIAEYIGAQSSKTFREHFSSFGHILKWLRQECNVEACTYNLHSDKQQNLCNAEKEFSGLILNRVSPPDESENESPSFIFMQTSDQILKIKNTFLHIAPTASGLLRAKSCPGRFVAGQMLYAPVERFRSQVAMFFCRRGIALMDKDKTIAKSCFTEMLRLYSENTSWKIISLIGYTVLNVDEVKLDPERMEKEIFFWKSPYMDVPCSGMSVPKRNQIVGKADSPQWTELQNVLRFIEGEIPRVWWLAAAQSLILVDAEAALECLDRAKSNKGICCVDPTCFFSNLAALPEKRCTFELKVRRVLMAEENIRKICICLASDRQKVITHTRLPASPQRRIYTASSSSSSFPAYAHLHSQSQSSKRKKQSAFTTRGEQNRNDEKRNNREGRDTHKECSTQKTTITPTSSTDPLGCHHQQQQQQPCTHIDESPQHRRRGEKKASKKEPSSRLLRVPDRHVSSMDGGRDSSPNSSISSSSSSHSSTSDCYEGSLPSSALHSEEKGTMGAGKKGQGVGAGARAVDGGVGKCTESSPKLTEASPLPKMFNSSTSVKECPLLRSSPRGRGGMGSDRRISRSMSLEKGTMKGTRSLSRKNHVDAGGSSSATGSGGAGATQSKDDSHFALVKCISRSWPEEETTHDFGTDGDRIEEKEFFPRTLVPLYPDHIAYAAYPRKLALAAVQKVGNRFRRLNDMVRSWSSSSPSFGSMTTTTFASSSSTSTTTPFNPNEEKRKVIRGLEDLEAGIRLHCHEGQSLATVLSAIADVECLLPASDINWARVGALGDDAFSAVKDSDQLVAGMLCSSAFRLRGRPPPYLEGKVDEPFVAMIRKALLVPGDSALGHAVRAQCFYGLTLTQRPKVARAARRSVRNELQNVSPSKDIDIHQLQQDMNKLVGRLCLLDVVEEKNMDAQMRLLKEAVANGIPEPEVCKTILSLARQTPAWLPHYRTALSSGIRSL